MHPPFYVVDHRIDHDVNPTEIRRVVRRNQPERLRLDLPPPGSPMVTYTPIGMPPPPRSGGEGRSYLARLLGRLLRGSADDRGTEAESS
jgi:hypothetical protein